MYYIPPVNNKSIKLPGTILNIYPSMKKKLIYYESYKKIYIIKHTHHRNAFTHIVYTR